MLISEQAALRWLQIENLSQIHAKPLAYTGTQGTRSQNMLDHDKWEKNIEFPISEKFSVFFFVPQQLSMTKNAATTTRMY